MSEVVSNIDIKKQLEFLKNISAIEEKLYQIGIESKFTNPEQKEEFKKHRHKWTSFVNTVKNNIGNILVNKLEQNEKGFEDGIKAITQAIQEINDTIGFLGILSRTIDIIENIIRVVI
jgi:predicted extracellular nuclease